MRFLYCLLFCLIALHLSAQDLNQVRISERFEDASLAKVIRTLRNKYDLKIAYDDALITGVTINGNYTDQSLPDFLDKILDQKGIDYQLLNGKIILIPKQLDLDVNTPSLFDLTVFGTVQDAITGENLPHALVRVRGSSMGTITNKEGYFALPQVPNDTSTIEISYVGYKKAEIKLVPGKTRRTLLVQMEENAIELSEFTVVENQRRTVRYGDEISQMTIDPKNLAALPSLGEFDIFRSLQLLPGIGGTDETSSALTIRNSPSAHNLVLFDGFTIYRLDHFFGVFSAINSDAVRDVQVYKGGFGAKYGGRVSGVVDITGNTGSFNEPNYSFGINLLSARFSINAPIDGGRGAFHISGRRAYTDIIRSNLFENLYRNFREQSNDLNQINANDVLRPDFHFYDLNLKGSYKLTQRDNLSLTLYSGRDNLDTSFEDITRDPNNPGNIQRISQVNENAKWGNTGLGLTWSTNWNRNIYSSLQFAYSDHSFNYVFSDTTKNNLGDVRRFYGINRVNDVEDLQFNLKNEFSIGDRHKVDFGVNVSSLRVMNESRVSDQNTPPEPLANTTSTGSITSVYASDKYYITPRLLLNPGMRVNFTSVSDNTYFSHRLGAIYTISPSLELKVSTGRYFQIIREQVFDDPFSNNQDGWVLSDENTDPDRRRDPDFVTVMEADHFIAGFQFDKNSWIIDVEFYTKKIKGLTERIVSHVFDRTDNQRNPEVTTTVGTSDITGMDFLIQKAIGPYQGWLSYTKSTAFNQFDGINNGNEIRSRQHQTDEIKFVNIVELPDWNLSATWIYGSGRPFYRPSINFIRNNQGEVINYEVINTEKEITKLPVYQRFDVSVARKFGNEYMKGEIGLSILNVFNRANVQSRRLNRNALDDFVSGDRDQLGALFRDVNLLEITPSIFFNLYF